MRNDKKLLIMKPINLKKSEGIIFDNLKEHHYLKFIVNTEVKRSILAAEDFLSNFRV
jgi:hypothetical protein